MRAWPLLLPLAALALIAGGLASMLVARDLVGGDGQQPAPSGAVTVSPTASPAPRLRPDASVCQSLLRAPDPGQPRVFPAVYTQHEEVLGLAVVAGPAVSPAAFGQARRTIETMFAANDLLSRLVEHGVYVIVAARNQGILDLPEFGCLADRYAPGFFEHVCGIADRADYPVATVNELDLLGDADGPCRGLNILYHELGHLVQNWALGPADYFDVRHYYQEALDAGKYRGLYAATNASEYFAEATQAYFLSQEPDGVRDRAWLSRYDPRLYALVDRVYRP
ncbi:MAG: hypothetical protein IT304_06080 [Dehalococcoidia bacterium]|nr:hypothetical protein [Dehalococcoidia bacterium]